MSVNSKSLAALEQFLSTILPDWKNDDHLKDTPKRLEKMYRELFSGLSTPAPEMTTFFNDTYAGPVFVEGIDVLSMCAHHFAPFIGKATVVYMPQTSMLGLSKIHRMVDWCARRPQTQENLTQMVLDKLSKALGHSQIGVRIDAEHHCVKMRGVKQQSSTMTTMAFGVYLPPAYQQRMINHNVKAV